LTGQDTSVSSIVISIVICASLWDLFDVLALMIRIVNLGVFELARDCCDLSWPLGDPRGTDERSKGFQVPAKSNANQRESQDPPR
jgi:hypothetical protein